MNYGWPFRGGIHLPGHKQLSNETPIVPANLPPYLVLPLSQHIGAPPVAVVEVGQRVLKGQVVARCITPHCPHPDHAMIHAPTSGTVIAVESRPVPHASGLSNPCVVLEPDGQEQWAELLPDVHHAHLTPQELSRRIAEAGIIGLGGAGFPAHLKIQHGSLHTLILNGAECEPYITCDDRLMREQPTEILTGALILAKTLGGVDQILVGIEDNKPQALAAMRQAAQALDGITVREVPTRYPMGGERQLIKTLIGREIPLKTPPPMAGVLVHNVGTVAAIYHAVTAGKPLLSRIITVTGSAVDAPKNLEVLIGTPVQHLLAQCGCQIDQVRQLVMGGPMMGLAFDDPNLPVLKTTNCILAQRNPAPSAQPMPCIRCGACERVCPMQLLPQQLYWYSKTKNFDQAKNYHLFDCILCGCCSYVCPSHIPLVDYYRYARSEIRAQDLDRKAAELAKKRHHAKAERLEREKTERLARHAKAILHVKPATEPSPVQQAVSSPDTVAALANDKKAAILAAKERAAAKKAAKQAT